MNLLDVEIKPFSDFKKLDEVYFMFCENLGRNYLNKKQLLNYVKNNKIFVAKNKHEIIGAVIIEILNKSDFYEDYKIQENSDEILVIKTIATKYHGQGIGKAIFSEILKIYDKFKVVYCPAWTNNGNTNLSKLLNRFNFVKIIEIQNFWFEDSIGKQNYCPICNTPCHCSMSLYKLLK